MKKLMITVVSILASGPVQAAEGALATGRVAFHGDLSDDASSPIHLLQLRQPVSAGNAARSFTLQPWFGFEVLQTSAAAKATGFPYDEGASLSLLGFFMTSGICLPVGLPLDLCGGIGIGTLNVNSAENRQDYGTWNYDLSVKYLLTETVFVRLAGKKVGDVEQTRQGRAAHFWLTSPLLAVGVNY